jgi:hypothetical protein
MKLRTGLTVGPFLLAALAVAGGEARAAVPAQLTHEGRLLDAGGQPVSASQVIIYKIYDAATGGTVLWTETLTVPFDNGYFSVQLGNTTPIPVSLLAGGTRYLGVQVGADDEMTPREQLGSVPYALLASVAEDTTGDIHPNSVSVAGAPVISTSGAWVGPAPLAVGDCMTVNGDCGAGTYMQPTFYLDRVGGNCPTDHPIFNGFKFHRCGTLNSSTEGLQLIMTCCRLQPP